ALFQTGYLTIDTATIKFEDNPDPDDSESTTSTTYYSLKIPNKEILDSYKSALFINLFPLLSDKDKKISCRDDITKSINAENAAKLTEILHDHLASVPYTQHADRVRMWNQDPKLGEFFFQAVFLSFFLGLGLIVIPEPMSSQGRSDIDIFLPNDVYVVLELKYIPNESGTKELPIDIDIDMDKKADEAIDQVFRTLQDKKYKNRASKVITAGLVIYDRDKVWVKFAGH
ncbi:MAG: PD-(D/E)XK nuclease domain-containing protein, partial [Deltaproteobacteria bacterium]|nr:PD-(D/E)XK nuclease domain-containing protein [Deltaproteobacteria bacterium]